MLITYVFYCDKKIICEKGFQDLRKSRQVHKQVEYSTQKQLEYSTQSLHKTYIVHIVLEQVLKM